MKETFLVLVCAFLSLGSGTVASETHARTLDDASWRADVTSTAQAIRDNHPRPFRTTTAEAFDLKLEGLLRDVPNLSDKAIIIRLVELVAMIDDGHTRLAIPRQHPEIGLEFGHTATAPPNFPALEFRQLPLAFEKFADGVFVVAASAAQSNLIGARVTSIGGKPITEALTAVAAITFAENVQLEALMGVDRLSLIEALVALGIGDSGEAISIGLVDRNGASKTVSVGALPPGPVEWTGASTGKHTLLRLKKPQDIFWSQYVANGNYLYMRIDEIADGEILLAEFVTKTLEMADRMGARLIIDLRNNYGGSADLNQTLVKSIIRNDRLNQYGRTFVLTGRRTFSAAQMLVNDLERYTRALFVGEPTGSRPDHFGDPKKIRLEHSGLTLRVSRLHWSSYVAFDDRDATYPDFPVPCMSVDFFAGEDPALNLAATLSATSLKALLRNALKRGDIHQLSRYTLDARRSPDTYQSDFSDTLLDLGDEFRARHDMETAGLAYEVGLFFYPEDEGLKAALGSLKPPHDGRH